MADMRPNSISFITIATIVCLIILFTPINTSAQQFDSDSDCESFSFIFNYIYCMREPCCSWNGRCIPNPIGCTDDETLRFRRQIIDHQSTTAAADVASSMQTAEKSIQNAVESDQNTIVVTTRPLAVAEVQLASGVWMRR